MIKSLTSQELKTKLENNDDFQLIDLREDHEFEDFNLGGINIPMDELFNSLDKIDKNRPVVFCCRTGRKSRAIIHTIKRKLELDNSFYSLAGGLETYLEEVF